MSNSYEVRILRLEDQDELFAWAEARSPIEDPIERKLASWTAPWRLEALAHYLPQGWSFGATDARSEKLEGFALAQPLLFFQGHTQSLWVEYLAGHSPSVTEMLLETLYRWCRDKHFQRVIFAQGLKAKEWSLTLPGQITKEGWWEMATTRVKS